MEEIENQDPTGYLLRRKVERMIGNQKTHLYGKLTATELKRFQTEDRFKPRHNLKGLFHDDDGSF